MGDAKIAICTSFLRSVTQFFRYFQVALMVVYGCAKISQSAMGVA